MLSQEVVVCGRTLAALPLAQVDYARVGVDAGPHHFKNGASGPPNDTKYSLPEAAVMRRLDEGCHAVVARGDRRTQLINIS
jgi:hypothetical protein